MVVSYTRGLSGSFKNLGGEEGIQIHFNNTIRSLIVAPKDKDITQKNAVIYSYEYNRFECDEEYIGESTRIFGERLKEHHRKPFPIYDYGTTSGHHTILENISIVGRESHTLARKHQGRVNDKYQMPHIWDEVLFHIPAIHLK